ALRDWSVRTSQQHATLRIQLRASQDMVSKLNAHLERARQNEECLNQKLAVADRTIQALVHLIESLRWQVMQAIGPRDADDDEGRQLPAVHEAPQPTATVDAGSVSSISSASSSSTEATPSYHSPEEAQEESEVLASSS